MAIYHYVERICRILVTPIFLYNKYDHENIYPGEPANIHIQSLINIIESLPPKRVRVNYHHCVVMGDW